MPRLTLERSHGRCVAGDAGSVLVLMPAAVLVLVVLGAIAVDFAIVHLGQRELANAAAAAANDAAVAALSEEAFYERGELRLDELAATRAAAASWERRGTDAVDGAITGLTFGVVDGQVVEVTVNAQGTVAMVFSAAIPAAPQARTVTAASTATAVRDDAPR